MSNHGTLNGSDWEREEELTVNRAGSLKALKVSLSGRCQSLAVTLTVKMHKVGGGTHCRRRAILAAQRGPLCKRQVSNI